jgi:hypothetical protein
MIKRKYSVNEASVLGSQLTLEPFKFRVFENSIFKEEAAYSLS